MLWKDILEGMEATTPQVACTGPDCPMCQGLVTKSQWVELQKRYSWVNMGKMTTWEVGSDGVHRPMPVGMNGWLLFFTVTVIALAFDNLLQGTPILFSPHGQLDYMVGMYLTILGLLGMGTAVALFGIKSRSALIWARIFLCLTLMKHVVAASSAWEMGSDGWAAWEVIFAFSYFGVWDQYLSRSRRVKATYR